MFVLIWLNCDNGNVLRWRVLRGNLFEKYHSVPYIFGETFTKRRRSLLIRLVESSPIEFVSRQRLQNVVYFAICINTGWIIQLTLSLRQLIRNSSTWPLFCAKSQKKPTTFISYSIKERSITGTGYFTHIDYRSFSMKNKKVQSQF